MENLHYSSIMVENTPAWRRVVADLISGEPVTASLQKEQKNGLLIQIGSSDKEALKRVTEKAADLV